jgi:hypothetical protein
LLLCFDHATLPGVAIAHPPSQNYVSGGLHIRGEVAISETCLYFVAYPVHQSLCTPQQNAKKKSPNNSIIYCNRSLGWLTVIAWGHSILPPNSDQGEFTHHWTETSWPHDLFDSKVLCPYWLLYGADGPATVVAIKVEYRFLPVYNIEVFGEHVYEVGCKSLVVHNACPTNIGAFATKAPQLVNPGVRVLEGHYIDDIGRIQPWRAHYDEFGRMIARTDYNAGNLAQRIPDVHYHTFEWVRGAQGREILSHVAGEFLP